MDDKKIIIILAAIVAVIAIAGFMFFSGMLNGNGATTTTPFETKFMEGSFVGNVTLASDKEKFMHSYEDKEHKITYNISTVDNSTALMEIYELQGVTNPEERTINGNDWNIYFTQAIPGNDTKSDDNNTMNIIIAQSQVKKEGYLIYMIVDGKSDVNSTGNVFGQSYTDYMQPLLESVTLKKMSGVPHIYDEFGLTEEQFAQQMDLIHQYKAGNTSALGGSQ